MKGATLFMRLTDFSARARRALYPFPVERLVAYAHSLDRSLVTINTLNKERELPRGLTFWRPFPGWGPTGDPPDMGVFRLCGPFPSSRPMPPPNTIHNSSGSGNGNPRFSRVVLARELHIDEIAPSPAIRNMNWNASSTARSVFLFRQCSSPLLGGTAATGKMRQPCAGFTDTGKEDTTFHNDFSSIDMLPI